MPNRSLFCVLMRTIFSAAGLPAQPPRLATPCAGMNMVVSFQGANDRRLPPKAREAERLWNAGDYPSALRAYEQAAKETPRNWTVLSRWGDLELQHGRPEDAIAAFNQMNSVLDTVIGHGDLGTVYERTGDYTSALRSYRRAADLCPAFPDLYTRIASLCYRLGLYE